MNKHLLNALIFAIVIFLADAFKHLLIYSSALRIDFTTNSALDILISVILGFIFGLFVSWGLDLKKNKQK